ncbi:hypothetical protein QNM16_03670 [Pseudoalteromonas sp. B95]|nr:hypothetical protein [Pseudoalteromonas sp. B95]
MENVYLLLLRAQSKVDLLYIRYDNSSKDYLPFTIAEYKSAKLDYETIVSELQSSSLKLSTKSRIFLSIDKDKEISRLDSNMRRARNLFTLLKLSETPEKTDYVPSNISKVYFNCEATFKPAYIEYRDYIERSLKI